MNDIHANITRAIEDNTVSLVKIHFTGGGTISITPRLTGSGVPTIAVVRGLAAGCMVLRRANDGSETIINLAAVQHIEVARE